MTFDQFANQGDITGLDPAEVEATRRAAEKIFNSTTPPPDDAERVDEDDAPIANPAAAGLLAEDEDGDRLGEG